MIAAGGRSIVNAEISVTIHDMCWRDVLEGESQADRVFIGTGHSSRPHVMNDHDTCPPEHIQNIWAQNCQPLARVQTFKTRGAGAAELPVSGKGSAH